MTAVTQSVLSKMILILEYVIRFYYTALPARSKTIPKYNVCKGAKQNKRADSRPRLFRNAKLVLEMDMSYQSAQQRAYPIVIQYRIWNARINSRNLLSFNFHFGIRGAFVISTGLFKGLTGCSGVHS